MAQTDRIETIGRAGIYLADGNVISFQMGEDASPMEMMPMPASTEGGYLPFSDQLWLGVQGYSVLARGRNNTMCEEVEREIKQNRLLPRLYSKEIKMLYGHGPVVYRQRIDGNKLLREFARIDEVDSWLHSWPSAGMQPVEEFCKACIKNFYYFGDFFVKWRFSRGSRIGMTRVVGMEAMENKHCLLATDRRDVAGNLVDYSDLRYVTVGRWGRGMGCQGGRFKVYPRVQLSEVANYQYAAISHHREKSVGEFYGVNETHQGARPYIQGSNKTAHYINSFLRNSLAAKIHIIIPNAWVESKRNQMQRLCEENKVRKSKGEPLVLYNDIEIGTEMRESLLVQYIRMELRKFSSYLTGAGNQGKAYSSFSFTDASGHEQQWKIESIDMKYKEYIDSLIAYDKRTEQALLSSVGLDAAISAVDKDGVISKSGSDSYYNYLIYIMSLTPEDEICAEPLNMALKVNFPELFAQGYRIGFYREVPQRQEDVSPQDRLNRQQS